MLKKFECLIRKTKLTKEMTNNTHKNVPENTKNVPKSLRFQIKINDVDFCLFMKKMLDNEEKADLSTKERDRERKKNLQSIINSQIE